MGSQTASSGTPMFFMRTCASKMAAVRCPSWSGTFLTATSSSRRGCLVVQVVSASLVPPTELSPEMEATLGAESRPKPVAVRQEKLLGKLNLDGLAHWSPGNPIAVRELVLAYHDVFALEGNELGCTSAIKHKIHSENSEPFKEWFWHIPPPLLEEVHASLWDMLEVGAIHPSQSPW